MLVRDFFNESVLVEQAKRISGVWPGFDQVGFLGSVVPQLPELEFKQRSDLILEGLLAFLPSDFTVAQPLLLQSLPPKIEGDGVEGYDGFICLPLGDFVVRQGMDHFDLSMEALYQLTQCFSAEFAIRSFLVAFPEKTLSRLKEWSKDPSVHVRRLVSEGTRPRLPWAFQLKEFVRDPSPTLGLLETLIDDPQLYVRRSVANHLNDISKDHPDLAVQWLAQQPGQQKKEFLWVVRHALRSLIKQQHPGALELLGFTVHPQVVLGGLELSTGVVRIGEDLKFSFELTSTSSEAQTLAIDFVVDYVKANGKWSAKVFKLSQKKLGPGQTIQVSKKANFSQRSTRKLYPGEHRLSIQIGALRGEPKPFLLQS